MGVSTHSLISGQSSQQVDADSIGLYYDIDTSLLPEAFQPFHQVKALLLMGHY